jgi:hypothetical protein
MWFSDRVEPWEPAFRRPRGRRYRWRSAPCCQADPPPALGSHPAWWSASWWWSIRPHARVRRSGSRRFESRGPRRPKCPRSGSGPARGAPRARSTAPGAHPGRAQTACSALRSRRPCSPPSWQDPRRRSRLAHEIVQRSLTGASRAARIDHPDLHTARLDRRSGSRLVTEVPQPSQKRQVVRRFDVQDGLAALVGAGLPWLGFELKMALVVRVHRAERVDDGQ